jgi:hypothetical protein
LHAQNFREEVVEEDLDSKNLYHRDYCYSTAKAKELKNSLFRSIIE